MDSVDPTAVWVAGRVRLGRYMLVIVYVAFVWDSILLLEDERRLVHRSAWTFPKVAYLLCRYYPMLIWPYHIWAWGLDHERSLCASIIKSLYTLVIPLQFFPQAVLVLRAWAFTERSLLVLSLLTGTLCSFIVMQFWALTTDLTPSTEIYEVLGKIGCIRSHSYLNGAASERMAYLMFASIVVDALATLIVVIIHELTGRSGSIIFAPRLGLLFECFAKVTHGRMAGFGIFGLMVTLNTVTGSLWLSPDHMIGSLASGWFVVTLIIPNVLACRLILQLRERVSPTETQLRERVSRFVDDEIEEDFNNYNLRYLHTC